MGSGAAVAVVGRLLAITWPYAAAGAVAVALAHWTPFIGYRAQIEGERSVSAYWKEQAGKHEKSAEDQRLGWAGCEATRGAEKERAEVAASEAAVRCDLAVQAARRSAIKIEEIIRVEPPRDEVGCPARTLIDPAGLREALTGD